MSLLKSLLRSNNGLNKLKYISSTTPFFSVFSNDILNRSFIGGYQPRQTHQRVKNNILFSLFSSSSSPPSSTSSESESAAAIDSSPTIDDLQFTTLVEMQQQACHRYGSLPFLGTKQGELFDYISFAEFGRQVNQFRGVLAKHNIGINDKVAMISNNRLEWAIAYYAANTLGAQIVPMYEAQSEKDWKYIIQDSEAKIILVATEKLYDKTYELIDTFANVQGVLCFDAEEDYLHSYKRWMKTDLGEDGIPPAFDPAPEHLTVIIYTSGTTGHPKGVELSHKNICSNVLGLRDLWGENLKLRQKSLAFLPWAHVFGMTCDLHALMASGSSGAIVPSREAILECFQLVKPSAMSSVPLLFNKVFDNFHKTVNAESPLKKKIVSAAFKVARERNHRLEFGQPVGFLLEKQYQLADKVVFSKVREKLGGNMQYLGSGGAGTPLPVLHFFEDIGVPICEGYGLTETSPVITASMVGWKDRRLGCVGRPLKGVTLRIIDPSSMHEVEHGQEGEICVSADSVMVGYRNNPQANDEVFFYQDGKRFFRTGDLGIIVDHKYLKITGRLKELYKLENGKYIVPAPLEDILCRSLFISQAMITGANKHFNVAVIVPDYAEIMKWAAHHNIATIDFNDKHNYPALVNFMNEDRIARLMTSEIVQACSAMKSYERIHIWSAIAEPFSQENQMLTPKMSLRRNNVAKVYQHLIDDMYEGKGGHRTHHAGTKIKSIEEAYGSAPSAR